VICSFEQVRGTGDAEVMRIAERQRGCIHRSQLLEAGVGRWTIAQRVRTRQFHPVYRDVYVVGRPRLEENGAEMAALLHLRGDALLSHRSAAIVWSLIDSRPGREDVEVTLVGRGARPQLELTIHRAATLHPDDIASVRGLAVTSPARTLVDLAGFATALELAGMLATVRHRRLATGSQIAAAIARTPRRKGVHRLRELLGTDDDTQAPRTRSPYERKLFALLRDSGLPLPHVNATVNGYEVDFHWPEQRLVVELDGFGFHADRRAFERDRVRDRRLALHGIQVVRVTPRQLDDRPFEVIADLAAIIALRGATAA
jgi:very-short-patch-repair endonuclease